MAARNKEILKEIYVATMPACLRLILKRRFFVNRKRNSSLHHEMVKKKSLAKSARDFSIPVSIKW